MSPGTKRSQQGLPVHSFRSLLADLATLALNRIQTGGAPVCLTSFSSLLPRPISGQGWFTVKLLSESEVEALEPQTALSA
jgi:hypothetical protein